MRAHAQLHRRAQRLPPAGIDTVALLPAALPQYWDASPLSALPLRRDGRRGVIGLRLHAGTAQALRLGGSGFLQAAQRQDAAADNASAPLRAVAAVEQRQLLARSTDALLGVLLASEEAAVWLPWQQPALATHGNGGWLR